MSFTWCLPIKEYLNFTNAYLSEPVVIATRKEVTFINEISELNGKNIGIRSHCPLLDELRKKYPTVAKNAPNGPPIAILSGHPCRLTSGQQ